MSDPLLVIVTAASLGAVILPAKAEHTMSTHANDAADTTNSIAAEPQSHPYLGMWVTGDERIRQELLPTGRYDEARGTRRGLLSCQGSIRGLARCRRAWHRRRSPQYRVDEIDGVGVRREIGKLSISIAFNGTK